MSNALMMLTVNAKCVNTCYSAQIVNRDQKRKWQLIGVS